MEAATTEAKLLAEKHEETQVKGVEPSQKRAGTRKNLLTGGTRPNCKASTCLARWHVVAQLVIGEAVATTRRQSAHLRIRNVLSAVIKATPGLCINGEAE